MIQSTWSLFSVQFPYNISLYEESGDGLALRLRRIMTKERATIVSAKFKASHHPSFQKFNVIVCDFSDGKKNVYLGVLPKFSGFSFNLKKLIGKTYPKAQEILKKQKEKIEEKINGERKDYWRK